MGLDLISEDDEKEIFKATYQAFTQFRIQIARLLGCTVYPDAYCRAHPLEQEDPARWKEWQTEMRLINDRVPCAGIFLTHSDYDGEWSPQECKAIASILESVFDNLPVTPSKMRIGDWRETTRKFISGLEYCVENDMPALFR